MVALIIISLFTHFFASGADNPSIYHRNDNNETKEQMVENSRIIVYQTNSGEKGELYFRSLTKILTAFEFDHSIRISPKQYPKIAIKVETALAPGLHTSKKLLDSVLKILESRGYKKQDIQIFDRELDGLKSAGLISEDSLNSYKGYEILHSRNDKYFMADWFHDSPLPPTSFDRAKFILKYPSAPQRRIIEERKSYLPAMLFEDAYWINLAIPMDDVFLGLDGAASNMSLGAISNHGRFTLKKTMAPATVAEVMAIPEIWDKRIFSILDFSNYQIANGQRFDSKYNEKEPRFYLSRNPFSLDYVAWGIINKKRIKRGLSAREINNALLFRYANELGLGNPEDTVLKFEAQ